MVAHACDPWKQATEAELLEANLCYRVGAYVTKTNKNKIINT